MSSLIESCYESGAWYIGQFAGESAWKAIIPSTVCDWKGTGEQLPTSAKVALLGVKILITVGATAASLAVPQLCLPMMAARQLAYSQVTIWLIKGVIAGSSMILNDYLTKQINGNVTPNQAEREEYIATVDKVKNLLSVGRYFLNLPLEEATCAFELLGIAAVYAYDMTHQGNGFIEKEMGLLSLSL